VSTGGRYSDNRYSDISKWVMQWVRVRIRVRDRDWDCVYYVNCAKFGQLILRIIIKIDATRCQILRLKCTKIVLGWGSAPDPAGEAYDAPQTPSRLGGDRRLGRLHSRAFGTRLGFAVPSLCLWHRLFAFTV